MPMATPTHATATLPPPLWTDWRPVATDADLSLTGFAAGTVISTAAGAMAVESLMAGDMLLSADGTSVPLRAISSGLSRKAQVVRIAPGAIGLCWNGPELVVGPAQTLMLDNWRTRSLTGGRALTPAIELTCELGVRLEPQREVRLYRLHCDAPVTILAQGLEAGTRPMDVGMSPGPTLH